MRENYHPYPPFLFNFYLDTDVTFVQNFSHEEELLDDKARSNIKYFKFTPYCLGFCNICGNETSFFCKDLRHPRDWLVCASCGSNSRYRSIARGVLKALNELCETNLDSLRSVSETKLGRKITIYDTQVPFSLGVVTYPVPYYLSLCDDVQLFISDLNDKPTQTPEWVQFSKQDLEQLTYKDETFDIVITSDVLEHVRRPDIAHKEISRVLKCGGRYIFTVPHNRNHFQTEYFVDIVDVNNPLHDVFLKEPIYHGDPNSEGAALVYQIFGADLDIELSKVGLDVHYDYFCDSYSGIIETELFYCIKSRSA